MPFKAEYHEISLRFSKDDIIRTLVGFLKNSIFTSSPMLHVLSGTKTCIENIDLMDSYMTSLPIPMGEKN